MDIREKFVLPKGARREGKMNRVACSTCGKPMRTAGPAALPVKCSACKTATRKANEAAARARQAESRRGIEQE